MRDVEAVRTEVIASCQTMQTLAVLPVENAASAFDFGGASKPGQTFGGLPFADSHLRKKHG